MGKAVVVIPTYNEAGSIKELIHTILKLHPDMHILVVDDNSPDGTGEIVESISRMNPNVQIMLRPAKAGIGSAYVDGFKKVLAEGADLVFEMDGDFSHDPHELPLFLDASKDADVVIGSRYRGGVRVVGWRFRRLFVSKMANIFISHVVVYPRIDDYTSGFRCYRRRVLEALDVSTIESDGYAFQLEMVHRVHRKGFTVAEVPIHFRGRERGISKISRGVVWDTLWLTLKYRAPFRDIVKTLFFSYKKYLFLDT